MILYKKRTTKGLIRQSRSQAGLHHLSCSPFLQPPPPPPHHQGPYNLYVLPIMTQIGPTCNPYGFSNMGPWTTVSNTLSVQFGLLLWDTDIISHIIENNAIV